MREFWMDRWCPCGNILNVLQTAMKRRTKSIRGGQVKKSSAHDDGVLRMRCCGREGIRGAALKGKNSSRVTLCLNSAAFKDTL